MKLLEKGKNGNYIRWIFSDGTKVKVDFRKQTYEIVAGSGNN